MPALARIFFEQSRILPDERELFRISVQDAYGDVRAIFARVSAEVDCGVEPADEGFVEFGVQVCGGEQHDLL